MRKLVCFFLVLLILMAACSKEEKDAQDNGEKENTLEQKNEAPGVGETTEEVENIFPLTGIGTNEAVDNRIISVMVNNHSLARPQTGLSEADIVFELLAEGSITRFLALYQSELPDVVGPVRSAREYYFELANGYDALYVYHGAAAFIDEMIQNRGIEFLNGSIYDNDGKLFKREAFRKAPHNSYLQIGAVYDAAEAKGYESTATYEPLEFLTADEMTELPGEDANHVKIVYSNKPMEIVEFDYDAANEKYTRFSDQEKTVDLNTEEPIQVENIFIVETDHEVIDDVGRRAIDLSSGGEGYLIQQGKIQEVQWKNQDGRIIPVKDDQPVGLMPGKTWINVIPSVPGLQQSVTISN
ncbi:lipoprotein YerB [Virgibacillus profundi]|uniref:Lipoprotein YerB n=1 Tax=Virgibacillus profundi TaxID=2024555 RepID=A0A2A2I7N9_9BACI|nr:DUF3048 domain-containing protein [Virgibacillus profundi]PAV28011.1 lipoprotein YerB [Virgibacillus profundi]PXY52189.1 DUF3048 domain-containing protein [Virgibacillus profundi]